MLSNKCCHVGRIGTRKGRSKMALCVEVIVYVFALKTINQGKALQLSPILQSITSVS